MIPMAAAVAVAASVTAAAVAALAVEAEVAATMTMPALVPVAQKTDGALMMALRTALAQVHQTQTLARRNLVNPQPVRAAAAMTAAAVTTVILTTRPRQVIVRSHHRPSRLQQTTRPTQRIRAMASVGTPTGTGTS